MPVEEQEWRPGSFTKNFSWGNKLEGLVELHKVIRLGFQCELVDVPRAEFRRRVSAANRPDFIPMNFFLFNRVKNGVNSIVVDELVFQALTSDHSPQFDKLALFAFNFSYVGRWKSAGRSQRRPALWAHHYIKRRVAKELHWDVTAVSADDIEKFVKNSPQYTGQTARKLATNLDYMYSAGHLAEFSTSKVSRWWVDALFLALDRLIEDHEIDGHYIADRDLLSLLQKSDFLEISGPVSLEKELAAKHLVALYIACGGRGRFSEEAVKERTLLTLPDMDWYLANDSRPRGALHPTNPRILKSIPRACAMLARYAGFEVVSPDELAEFDIDIFVRHKTNEALSRLREKGALPTMTAEELMKLTRDR